jgi:RHS repeat-associated protein
MMDMPDDTQRPAASRLERRRIPVSRSAALLFAAAASLLCTSSASALPEGARGWRAWEGTWVDNTVVYLPDPASACAQIASWHMGTSLVSIEPTESPAVYDCYYPHFLAVGGVHDYGQTTLVCKDGYLRSYEGCVKAPDPPRPPPCTAELAGGGAGSPDDPSAGNPVILSTGAKVQTFVDYVLPSPKRMAFVRHYRSRGHRPSDLGMGWTHSFDRYLHRDRHRPIITAYRGDGTRLRFRSDRDGSWEPSAPDIRARLTRAGDSGWRLHTEDGGFDEFEYNAEAGHYVLVKSRDAGGYVQSFTYDDRGQLEHVFDIYGRSAAFDWDGAVLSRIYAPGGVTIRYYYDRITLDDREIPGTERLIGMEATAASGEVFAAERYLYENPDFRHSLTGRIDANGDLYASWSYDDFNRVVLSTHAHGAERTAIDYDDDALTRTVTNARGKETVFRYIEREARLKLVDVDGKASFNCPAAGRDTRYDSHGRIASRTDWEGNVTSYEYDEHGRPVSVTYADGTADALPTTASWSARHALPERVVTAGKTVDLSYDEDGRLLRRTETDTTDSSLGQTRTWTYGYTRIGPPETDYQTSYELPVVNPQADEGLTGWTVTDGAFVAQRTYSSHRGRHRFRAVTGPQATMHQVVDLPASDYEGIDGDRRALRLAYWVRAAGRGDDPIEARVQFLDESGAIMSPAYGPGPDSHWRWQRKVEEAPIPPGARAVRLEVHAELGASDDVFESYVDTIGLTVSSSRHTTSVSVSNPSWQEGDLGWDYEGNMRRIRSYRGNLDGRYRVRSPSSSQGNAAARQTLTIPAEIYEDVDTGFMGLFLGWWQRGWGAAEIAAFDAEGRRLGQPLRSEHRTADDHRWYERSHYARLPPGTRAVRVSLVVLRPIAGDASIFGDFDQVSAAVRPRKGHLDERDRLVSFVDGPRTDVQDVTRFEYTDEGYLARITNASGHVTEITTHDPVGRPHRIVDPNGVETVITYHPKGWVETITVGSGRAASTTRFSYDAIGQVTRVEEGDGAALSYAYDEAHHLVTVADDHGERIEYANDAFGNPREIVHHRGSSIRKTQRRVYDELGRLLGIIGASGETTFFEHDSNGNTTCITNGLGDSWLASFDGLNRLVSEVDPLAGDVSQEYDARGNLAELTDARGVTTSYRYDGFGRVIQRKSPSSGTTIYEYDESDHVVRKIDGRGQVTEYAYDALGRLTERTYPGHHEQDVWFEYDQGDELGVGRLTRVVDATGTTTFTYDERGNTVKEERATAAGTFVLQYRYDRANRLTEVLYPSGRLVRYDRDYRGRVRAVTTQSDAGSRAVPVVTDIRYEPFGPTTEYVHGNGLFTDFDFDADYRMTGISTSRVQELAFSYDDAGRLIEERDYLDPSQSQSFEYDALGRLEVADSGYGVRTYSYDASGNRTSRTVADRGQKRVEEYHYDEGSLHLDSVSDERNTRAFAYDEAGNVRLDARGRDLLELSYDAAGRLSAVDKNGRSVGEYGYDAWGRRVSKRTRRSQTFYSYDRAGRLLAEHDEEGRTTRELVWLPMDGLRATPIAVVADVSRRARLYHVHSDHRGTPRAMTDARGSVVWESDLAPFGSTDRMSRRVGLDLRFLGQLYDPETGYHQNWHRDYDPTLGRYLQADPLGVGGGLNVYSYAHQNPMQYLDPDGRNPIALAWVGLAVASFVFDLMDPCVPLVAAIATVAFDAAGGRVLRPLKWAGDLAQAGKKAGVEAPVPRPPRGPNGEAFPDRPLPRDKNGRPMPESPHPHTQLGTKSSRRGESYPQAREFDATGKPVRDIDVTDHGRPANHTNPHQHSYVEPATGGSRQRGGGEALQFP